MIEQALYQHLQEQEALRPYLAEYAEQMAIFSQEAPADTDTGWAEGPQYGRLVFAVDLQGDPERTMGGMLAVDILCKEDEQFPEEIEPILRPLIHGYFFCRDKFVVAAQWKNTSYFTEPTAKVTGCTVVFDLLAFPVITTTTPDVVARLNEWTAKFPGVHVINYAPLPTEAWKPSGGEAAVYWRRVSVKPAGWIPDTFQTIWRTATIRGHIFAEPAEVATLSEKILIGLYSDKRLLKAGEAPIMVNSRNTTDDGADALRTGQLTVEATYGVVVYRENNESVKLQNFKYSP
jgi:hypothetical protein